MLWTCNRSAAVSQKSGTTYCTLQQARQRADVFVGDVCHLTRKNVTVTQRVSTNMSTPTATKATTPVPMGVSQMSSNVPKTETDEQESEWCQNEQDQECDGDGVCSQGQGWFQRDLFQVWNERTQS